MGFLIHYGGLNALSCMSHHVSWISYYPIFVLFFALKTFNGKGTYKQLSNISAIFFVISAFIIGYLVYDTVEKEHDRLQRKQPGQFDHET